jgi:hypothetical protein
LGPPGTPALFSRITIPICYAVFGLLMAIGIVAASVWAPTARPPQFVHGTGVRPSPVAGSGRMNAEKMSFDGRIDPYSHEEK